MRFSVVNWLKPAGWVSRWLLIVIALMLIGPGSAFSANEKTGPKAVFKTDRVLVEKSLLQGEPLEGIFEVSNEGDEVLQVLKVSPG